MQTISPDATVADLVGLSIRSGFSRFPVTGTDADDVVGVVLVKDALGLPVAGRDAAAVSSLMVEPFVVPESRDLGSLLAELRGADVQMAVVVDEFGGTAGLITVEDILEEIVGEIADEYDRQAPAFTRWQPKGTFVLPGSVHGDEVFDASGFEMPEGDYETLAGFVLDVLGRIPAVGDALDHDGWRLEVVKMDRHRVESVRLVAPVSGATP
jgi:CBS domain containing-hemolysin-like protein